VLVTRDDGEGWVFSEEREEVIDEEERILLF
jgi:hypothetical protein